MNVSRTIILVASAIGASASLGQAYGPDTCIQGYVWRDAFPGDHVCVTPDRRDQAADDNRQAAARREPGGGAYGPNTCRQGFVWREARQGDVVCVTPRVRTLTAQDNAQSAARRVARPAAPPPAQVTKVDERCDQYAIRAIRQYREASNTPGCAIGPDGRWQANYDAHYNWCLGAPDSALGSETYARDDHLVRCGAHRRY